MAGKFISPWELKKLENVKKPALEALVCPKCTAPLSIRATGHTTTIACGACNSIMDVSVSPDKTGTALTLAETGETKGITPALPLGSRCQLHGAKWEVIGFMVRSNEPSLIAEDHQWSEYLLFNPYKGYRWLVEDAGHWQYFLPLHEAPKEDKFRKSIFGKEVFDYSGHAYSLTSKMTAQVQYLMGEFYWRVRYQDKTVISEYKDEPYTLTQEQTDSEVNWAFGETLTKPHLLEAFKDDPAYASIKTRLPKASEREENLYFEEIFPNLKTVENPVYMVGAFLFAVFMILHVMTGILYQETTVFETKYTTPLKGIKQTESTDQVSDEFEITSTYGGLGLSISALDLDNEWLSFEGELVNQATGETESFDLGLEFYSGRDEDGYWSEGSKREEISLQSLSPGKYKLITHTEASLSDGPHAYKPLQYEVKLTENHQPSETFGFITFLLLLFPLALMLTRLLSFLARWIAKSDTDVLDW